MPHETVRGWIAAKGLAARLAVTEVTIWRWSRDPDNSFPSPVKLGANCTRWRLEDIEAWEASLREAV